MPNTVGDKPRVYNENVRQRYLNLARKWEELAKETGRQESLRGRNSSQRTERPSGS